MSFYGGGEIEHLVREREVRNRAKPDLDTSQRNPLSVCLLAGGDTLLGMIHAIDSAFYGLRSQLVERPATPAANIKNRVLLLYVNVRQTPICNPRVPRVHVPQENPSQPSLWLLALIAARLDGDCFHGSPVFIRWNDNEADSCLRSLALRVDELAGL